MTVRYREDDTIGRALRFAERRNEELLQDLATRIRWEEFRGLKMDRFAMLLAVAIRSLWTSSDEASLIENLDRDYQIPGGWNAELLRDARKDEFYDRIVERLEEEFEAMKRPGRGFKSLSDESDPTTADAARSLRLKGMGEGKFAVDSLKERYDRAQPKQLPTIGAVFNFPPEALARMMESEEMIEATGVKLLPEETGDG